MIPEDRVVRLLFGYRVRHSSGCGFCHRGSRSSRRRVLFAYSPMHGLTTWFITPKEALIAMDKHALEGSK